MDSVKQIRPNGPAVGRAVGSVGASDGADQPCWASFIISARSTVSLAGGAITVTGLL